jgi:hypothetical protein
MAKEKAIVGAKSPLHSFTFRRDSSQTSQHHPMPGMRSVPLANPARIPPGTPMLDRMTEVATFETNG